MVPHYGMLYLLKFGYVKIKTTTKISYIKLYNEI